MSFHKLILIQLLFIIATSAQGQLRIDEHEGRAPEEDSRYALTSPGSRVMFGDGGSFQAKPQELNEKGERASTHDFSIILPEIFTPQRNAPIEALRFVPRESVAHKWDIILWGLSYHMARPTKLNERNPGVGYRTHFGNDRYAEVEVVHDSYRGTAWSASYGKVYHLAKWNGCEINGSIEAVFMRYGFHPLMHRDPVYYVATFPGMELGCSGVTLEMRAVPKIDLSGVVVFLFNIRINGRWLAW